MDTGRLLIDAPAAFARERPRRRREQAAGWRLRRPRECSQALVRACFRVLLEGDQRIRVVGEAATGEEAVALTLRIRPDVVMIDSRMPGLDSVEATGRMSAESGVAVMLLTGSEGDERIFAALRAGASGLLLEDTEPSELVRAVEALARGEALLSPSLTRRLIAELASWPEPSCPSSELLDELTPRERDGGAGGARAQQRRDHGTARGQLRHGQDPRQPRWSSSTPTTAPSLSSSPTSPGSWCPRRSSRSRPPTALAGDMTTSSSISEHLERQSVILMATVHQLPVHRHAQPTRRAAYRPIAGRPARSRT